LKWKNKLRNDFKIEMKKIIRYFYLTRIRIQTLFWMLFQVIKPRSEPLFICLTIDCESKFRNKIEIEKRYYHINFYQSCLELNELLEQYGWRATFFINYPEIKIFQNEKDSPSYLIKILVEGGQDIELHLHPALINPEKNPDLSYYSKQQIRKMIREGKELLASLTNKEIIAFRAGGYSVGRAEKIINILEEEGFIVDSSVMPGANNLHQAKFDFSKAPYLNWYHPDYNDFSTPGNAKIIELPITTIIKTNNNFNSSFFRFDAKNVKIIKNFIKYTYFNNHFRILTFIWHSKEIFDESGHPTEYYHNIKKTISLLKNLIDSGKKIEVGSIRDFIGQHLSITQTRNNHTEL